MPTATPASQVPSQYVSLNVGGDKYVTLLSTLMKQPNSMLAAMFRGLQESAAGGDSASPRIGLAQHSDGSYIIDRDGPSFRHILAYLRNDSDEPIPLPGDSVERRRLAQEADYFLLGGLSSMCRGAAGTTHSVSHVEFLTMLNSGGGALSLPLTDLRATSLAYQQCGGFNLRGCNLAGIDLRETSLKGADLRGACLVDADCRGADFTNASLQGANLCGANLSQAVLHRANVTNTVLTGSVGLETAIFEGLAGSRLVGADLRALSLKGKDLSHADLSTADLRGVDLRDTQLKEASLAGANLLGATGLAYVSGFSAGRGGGQVQSWSAHLEGANLDGAVVDDELFQHLQAYQQQQLEAALAGMDNACDDHHAAGGRQVGGAVDHGGHDGQHHYHHHGACATSSRHSCSSCSSVRRVCRLRSRRTC